MSFCIGCLPNGEFPSWSCNESYLVPCGEFSKAILNLADSNAELAIMESVGGFVAGSHQRGIPQRFSVQDEVD